MAAARSLGTVCELVAGWVRCRNTAGYGKMMDDSYGMTRRRSVLLRKQYNAFRRKYLACPIHGKNMISRRWGADSSTPTRCCKAADPPGGPLSPESQAMLLAGIADLRAGRVFKLDLATLDSCADDE